jgi:hypothetical protein
MSPHEVPQKRCGRILAKIEAIVSTLLILPLDSLAWAGMVPRPIGGWTWASGWGTVGPHDYLRAAGPN